MFPSPHARWYDFGIYAYATILQLGKLRSERLNEQTILVITHSLWVWRRRVFCQPSGPATLQATHTVQCVRAQISQMLSLGTARGLAPSHCVYPPVCLPLLCLPKAGSSGLEGWSLEQVPEAAWPALGSQVELLSSIPRCLSILAKIPHPLSLQPSVAAPSPAGGKQT